MSFDVLLHPAVNSLRPLDEWMSLRLASLLQLDASRERKEGIYIKSHMYVVGNVTITIILNPAGPGWPVVFTSVCESEEYLSLGSGHRAAYMRCRWVRHPPRLLSMRGCRTCTEKVFDCSTTIGRAVGGGNEHSSIEQRPSCECCSYSADSRLKSHILWFLASREKCTHQKPSCTHRQFRRHALVCDLRGRRRRR